MMTTLAPYVRSLRKKFGTWAVEPGVYSALRMAGCLLAGFGAAAASLGSSFLPLALGLCCACTGWSAFFAAIGGCAGYLLLWGSPGWQGVLWLLSGLGAVAFLSPQRIFRQTPLLMPAVAAFLTAAWGLAFQMLFGDRAPVVIYLLRVVLALCSCWVFGRVIRSRDPICEWISGCFAALSLGQLALTSWLNFGYIFAAGLCVAGAFPGAVMAGLGLDLAGITPVPMTAVLCCGYLVRFLPRCPKWLRGAAPMLAGLFVQQMVSCWDYACLPGLLLGGVLGTVAPVPGRLPYRRGETGVAQVRLEMAAGVLMQTQQLLQEAPPAAVDEDALVRRAAEAACAGCPCRHNCKDSKRIAQLPGPVLHKDLLNQEEVPVQCRRTGRFLAQLHRSQEQLRTMQADRERQREYKAAVTQQYQFLSAFLQDLADQLPRRPETVRQIYRPSVQVFGNRPAEDSGDRCLHFPGTGGFYYVVLCDGMGTGPGAVEEGTNAITLLKRLLCAGYPAQHALRSLNSLCALRERAASVTVDLVQLHLDTGRVELYKWGAPSSWLVTKLGVERLGIAGPPPGLSVTQYRETTEQLSLRRGELLVLVSDGMDPEQVRACCTAMATGYAPRELARALMACGQVEAGDDATVVLIRLDINN